MITVWAWVIMDINRCFSLIMGIHNTIWIFIIQLWIVYKVRLWVYRPDYIACQIRGRIYCTQCLVILWFITVTKNVTTIRKCNTKVVTMFTVWHFVTIEPKLTGTWTYKSFIEYHALSFRKIHSYVPLWVVNFCIDLWMPGEFSDIRTRSFANNIYRILVWLIYTPFSLER